MYKIVLFWMLILTVFVPQELGAEDNGMQGVQYQAGIKGDITAELREALVAQSDIFDLKDRPAGSTGQLEYRAGQDISSMKRAMQAFGYFEARIDFELRQEKDPLEVRFHVQPGPEYSLGTVELQDVSHVPDPELQLPLPTELGLEPGSGFRARAVQEAKGSIRQDLRNKGRPFVQVELQEAVVDRQQQAVHVQYAVDPGPAADFGQVQLKGLEEVHRSYILERVPWQQGELFQARKLEELRRTLVGSGLFSMVQVEPEKVLDEKGQVDIIVQLRERDPRTIRTGLGYEADIGPELSLGWEHRNVRGKGRHFTSSFSLSSVEIALDTEFTMPRFLRPGQALRLSSGIYREDTDAYDSRSLSAAVRVERRLKRNLQADVGLGYRMLRVSQEEDDDFGLLSVPASLRWDSRDQILDPGRGVRAGFRLTPYTDTFGQNIQFFKTQANVSHYLQLVQDKRFILASRAKIGGMGGASRANIPADERFYAGGGGSVRGYGYQKLGPLDEDDDPVGGRSRLELGLELRWRMAENSGIVGFLDGGQVYKQAYPDLGERMLWGAGLGYRYYTGFGPLRLDVAVPLDKRRGVDSDYHIYISIGQSF